MTDIVKKYSWMEKTQRWVVSDVGDSGVTAVMTRCGAKLEFNARRQRSYWYVADDVFQKIKDMLHGVGYELHSAEAQAPNLPAPLASPDEETLTVAHLNRKIADVIKNQFASPLWVRGEIASFRGPSKSGHVYFSLIGKDDDAAARSKSDKSVIKVCIWKNDWARISKKLENSGDDNGFRDGLEIRVYGSVNFYCAGGEVSFCIHDIDEHFAEGVFYKRKYEIFQKLQAEDLHDKNSQLPMPRLPLHIALFSNKTAAGFEDFIKTLGKECFPYRITLFSVALQGAAMEPSFLNAFDALEAYGVEKFDIAVICRGGGSFSDLDVFNSFSIAKKIATSPLKFIIAVGHERDKSVLDLIAQGVKTPTAAGEMLNRALLTECDILDHAKKDIIHCIEQKRSQWMNQMKQIALELSNGVKDRQKRAEGQLISLQGKLEQAASEFESRQKNQFEHMCTIMRNQKDRMCERMMHQLDHMARDIKESKNQYIQEKRFELVSVVGKLKTNVADMLRNEDFKLKSYEDKLQANDPRNLLRMGYVRLITDTGDMIKTIDQVALGQHLHIRLQDGKIGVTVDDLTHEPSASDE